MSEGSVTHWLVLLRAGDPAAAQPLWERYFRRLVGLARARLRGTRRRAADEEDVALSAFDSFCRGAEQGRFPRLDDRDDLWALLVTITARKAADLRQHEGRKRRDCRRVRQDPGASPGGPGAEGDALAGLIGREPDPAFAAEVAEEYRRLLDKLHDDELRRIAERKLEGYTNQEIADQLDCSPATVERRLRLIRGCWEQEAGGGAGGP
jgi:RNA polymerase sigma factor (sigma-70 family)